MALVFCLLSSTNLADRTLGYWRILLGQLPLKHHVAEVPVLKRLFLSWVLGFVLFNLALGAAAEDAAAPEAPTEVVRYVELTPTFVTNYGISDSGHLRYIKADVTVRVNNKEAEYAARYHLPALRDSIVLLLARQDESTIATVTGRETIKAEALDELRAILQREEGEAHIVDLMFTNFVVQR